MTEKKYPSVEGITPKKHIEMVRDIFATVTAHYDLLNHVLSLRRDIAWRRYCVRRMAFTETHRLLDVATGTADLALEAAAAFPGIQVTGLDFVEEMLVLAKRKAAQRHLSERVRFLQGDALDLPFPSGSFDTVSVAFGIRNMPDRIRALREMIRVAIPGGRVMVLEFNLPQTPVLRPFYAVYLRYFLPRLARTVSANPGAYKYLADSVIHFSSPMAFKGMMEEAGLINVTIHPLTLGVTNLYSGEKPVSGR